MKHMKYCILAMACLLFFIIPNNGSLYAQEIGVMGSVPTGTVLPFYGGNSQLPPGYLFCNGETISRTRYPRLYVHLIMANPSLKVDEENVKLPDLRGEFIRGWDNGRNIDQDRKLGSPQEQAVGQHTHTIERPGNYSPNSGWAQINNGGEKKVAFRNKHSNQNITTRVNENSPENRPRNIAVNFIIKD